MSWKMKAAAVALYLLFNAVLMVVGYSLASAK
jgi:hypothetical protein